MVGSKNSIRVSDILTWAIAKIYRLLVFSRDNPAMCESGANLNGTAITESSQKWGEGQ